MRTILCAALATTLATQTQALSCLRPDIARSFENAAQAEERYLIMLGTYDYGTVPSSDTGDINNPREVEVRSTFQGQYLTREGFVEAPELNVTIRLECAGPWCGAVPRKGTQVLAFVEQLNNGYVLSIGACGGEAFVAPSAQQLEQVQSCMRGGACAD